MLSNTEAERLGFEIDSYSSSTLSTKNRTHFKKQAKKQVCPFSQDYMSKHNENEDQNGNRSNR